jgi:hypothetical protein
MFPTRQSRIKTAFRRSIDAAIDFATLGEYGLASAWEDSAAAAGSGTATRARQDTPSLAWRAGAPAPGAARAAGAAAVATASGAARAAGAAAVASAGSAPRTATVLQPASAAARALRGQQATPDLPVPSHCSGQPLRGRALERTLPRAARKRDGMAPREQRCAADAA